MPFQLQEATIGDMQNALASGELTSRDLVLMYLERIAKIDKSGPKLNSVLEINPDALFIAEAMDHERRTKGARGPLHGIPILVKDNINTHDKMHTSAGSLALKDSYAPYDAFLVTKLREAGAIILGKANMTEFANFMTQGMPSGYSSRGGQVINPYVASKTPSGSSSGSGVSVAANLCAAAIGTETCGSIMSPAFANGIVGIKPTVGLVSRSGVIPISNSQDTAGPMTRTVEDAAILLGALTGIDESDPATWSSHERAYTDYTPFLDKEGLRGKRIGINRGYYHYFSDEEKQIIEKAIKVMEEQGAVIIDNTDIPYIVEEVTVLLYEFKASMNAYLATLGPNAPMKTMRDIVAFNKQDPAKTLKYGQKYMVQAEYGTSGTMTEPVYLEQRAKELRISQTEGIDRWMNEHNLNAIFCPAVTDAAAVAGYPSIMVPVGFTADGYPFGVTFIAKAYMEPELIKIGYAFEQATKARVAPKF